MEVAMSQPHRPWLVPAGRAADVSTVDCGASQLYDLQALDGYGGLVQLPGPLESCLEQAC
jgi:hypothetical protein